MFLVFKSVNLIFTMEFGGSCRDGCGGVGHAGVGLGHGGGWVMQRWGGSCRGGVGHTHLRQYFFIEKMYDPPTPA